MMKQTKPWSFFPQKPFKYAVATQEAAIMVTLPTNISQMILGYLAAWAADWATRRNISTRQQQPAPTSRDY
jgi:hypothetical protein